MSGKNNDGKSLGGGDGNGRLAIALHNAAGGVTIVEPSDGDGFRTVYANPAFERMTGYGAAELIGRDWQVLHGADTDPEAVEKAIWALRGHEPATVEFLYYRKNGTPFWNQVNLTPIFDAGGTLDFYLCMHADVTERVRVRLTLEERTAMLADAERIAHLGHWSWELETGRVWWSEEVYRMRGLDPARTQPTLELTLSSYHPGDRDAAQRILRHAADEQVPFSYDTRIVRPGGEIRHAHIEGRHVTRVSGASWLFGIIQDVTEQRQADDALRRREEQYRRLMETVPLGIKEIDTRGRIIYTNPVHDLDLGYSREEMIGKSVFDLIPTENLRGEAVRHFRTVLQGRPVQFNTAYRAADGKVIDVDVRAAATRDSRGRVDSIITVTTDITQRLGYEKRLRQLAYYDSLTGLGNRGLFREYLDQALSAEPGRILAVALINVDNFKIINEAFGRETGDFVINSLASRLQQCAADGEQIARMGGDELGVIIAGSRDRSSLVRRLRDLKSALESPLEWQGYRIDLSLSVGAAAWPHDAGGPDELLQAADTAVRDVKENEPGGIRFYSAAMKTAAEEFMVLRSRIREALARDEFFLEYQPQVDLDTNRIVGFEALVRWRTPQGKVIQPDRFIPVAEESGDIALLGWWILKTVCAQINAWKHTGLTVVPVAVNLSARQLLQDDLAGRVGEILRSAGVDSRHIQLELTETALMADSRGALRRMEEISDLGISMALDDFGTGYSSLSHLARFPIETLKIDRSFIVEMTRSTKQASLVSAIIAMGNQLGLDVMAEGVENERQLRFLKSHQCDMAQGFYYSKPVSAADAADLLRAGIIRPLLLESV
ncbi:MAG TPA: EAL domain-containing protein [Gammaproteobacteria bacterium]|nr:EAL domain-containing protein [Gammaproteobacteria bacterium]